MPSDGSTDTFDRALIGGQLVATHGKWIALDSAHTGEQDRLVRLASEHDADLAVRSAAQEQAAWSKSTPARRQTVLRDLAAALDDASEQLASSICAEVGTPPNVARQVQVGLAVQDLHVFADVALRALEDERVGHSDVRYLSAGVVLAITPWNYPLHQVMSKLGAALAAGCTLVIKPSELTPRTNRHMMEIIGQTVPAGVVNVVDGDPVIGGSLVEHPQIDAVSFTGSTRAGRAVAARCAQLIRPCSLELGGKSPAVILPHADLRTALHATVDGAFLNSGQTCSATTRAIIPSQDFDSARAHILERVERLTPRLGPVISQAQYDRIQGFLSRAIESGVDVLVGGTGRPPDRPDGFYVRPTVLAVDDPGHEIVQEEVFGPVLVIQRYDDIAEAIHLANNVRYGLAATVWGGDDQATQRVVDALRVGQVAVNGAPFDPEAPFGGFRQSGYGRELGVHGIREFQRPMAIRI